jgi:hypothetical protein
VNQSSDLSGGNVAARQRYDALVAAVDRAISEADPKSLLEVGMPSDEYSLEVGTIVPRVSRAMSREEVRSILWEEFQRWFGDGEAGSLESWEVPAEAIWEAVLTFRRAV